MQGLAFQNHLWWNTNAPHSPLDFLEGHVRPAAYHWRAWLKALPIDARPHQHPPGYGRHDIRMAYFGPSGVHRVVRRVLEYAAAACEPWLSATTSKIERLKLEAARAINGLVRSTPVETVLAEVHLPPISKRNPYYDLTSCPIFHPRTIVVKLPLPPAESSRGEWSGASLNFPVLVNSTQSPGLTSDTLLLCAAFHHPWDMRLPIPTIIIPADKKMSPSQQKNLSHQPLATIHQRTSTSSPTVR